MPSSIRVSDILRYGVVSVALLLTGYNGIVEGINATHFADTPGMKVATATQLLYGCSAPAAVVVFFARRHLVFRVLIAWGIGVVLTGVLAPIVYSGRSVRLGLAVGAGAALVVGLVLWAYPAGPRIEPGVPQ